MGDKDKYRVEVEASLDELSETISSLRQKAELHPGMAKGAGSKALDEIERQMQELRATLDKLEKTPKEMHEGLKQRINAYTGDLNEAVRKAWTYYK